MKRFALTATLALAACAGNRDAQPKAAAPEVGMANPASVFFEKQGGKSEIRKNADGSEYGVCRMAKWWKSGNISAPITSRPRDADEGSLKRYGSVFRLPFYARYSGSAVNGRARKMGIKA